MGAPGVLPCCGPPAAAAMGVVTTSCGSSSRGAGGAREPSAYAAPAAPAAAAPGRPAPRPPPRSALQRPASGAAVRLPRELIARCIEFLAGSVRDVQNAGAVCRLWHNAAGHDLIWLQLTRRRFWVLPLLELAEEAPRQAVLQHLALLPAAARGAARMLLRLLRISFAGAATGAFSGQRRELYQRHRAAIRDHQIRLSMQREVRDHTPYVLHVLLVAGWAGAWVFVCLLIVVQEGLWFESAPVRYEHAFGVLYAVFGFIFLTVLINVVAMSHYEPQPLVGRVAKHSRTIGLTTLMMAAVILVTAVTRFIHINALLPPEDRSPWIFCLSPGIAVLAGWQLLVVGPAMQPLCQWARCPGLPSAAQVHGVLVNAYPLYCLLSLVALALYLDGAGRRYLIAASMPWLLGTVLLTVTFGIDYCQRGELTDGVCSASLASLSAFPVGYILWAEPRGFHLTPLLCFLTLHAFSYGESWRRKARRDRLLRYRRFPVGQRGTSRGGWG
eukprot:TRINITY_DN13078_c0_g1_i1.p1 TRINITY_DN13078_c0_g1~~TRINITY_DN13078_c0_g1_i1.p1  ORF type:complete len:499 (+),score=75.39 TRINITY_DN13078_c0_g1_i1:103-1599(+)